MVGCPWSTAAILTPAESIAVANRLESFAARRAATRVASIEVNYLVVVVVRDELEFCENELSSVRIVPHEKQMLITVFADSLQMIYERL